MLLEIAYSIHSLLYYMRIGVEVTLPDRSSVICKAKLLFNVCDLPAKAVLMNCNQFNGAYGCPCCKHEGEQVCMWLCLFIPLILESHVRMNLHCQVCSGRGQTRAYGYHNHMPFIMRNNTEHLEHARKALEDDEVFVDLYWYTCNCHLFLGLQIVCGVKGYSVMYILDHFDLINGNPVDYMHCVLLGVMKRLLRLWLESANHRCDWLVP